MKKNELRGLVGEGKLESLSGSKKNLFFDNLITVDELASAFGLSPKTIRNWVARRDIPFVRIKGKTFFLRGSIEEWIKRKEFNQCL